VSPYSSAAKVKHFEPHAVVAALASGIAVVIAPPVSAHAARPAQILLLTRPMGFSFLAAKARYRQS
jgi:hypothetical protein